jgi:acetylornithine deacetylase/succinyl-diaminopimelate desuccinylase-like protein
MSRATRAEKAYALLKDLLKVDTTNPPGNESAAADIVEAFLKPVGIKGQRLAKTPGRDNLITQVGSSGETLLLAAHLDVVPCDPERWTVPPFAAEEREGYLYGRGAVDMKNFAAMAAVLLSELQTHTPSKRVIGAFLADEEAGCAAGSQFLVEEHADLVRADYMLGEGGGFTQYAAGVKFYPVARAEKGHLTARLSFTGTAGHASLPHPDNAAFKFGMALARLAPGGLPLHPGGAGADFLQRLGARAGFQGWAISAMSSPVLAPAALALMPLELSTQLRPMISHSVSPTMFKGATAINIIPEIITADLDVRVLPGYTADQVLAEIRTAVGAEVEVEAVEFTPGVESSIDTPLYEAIEKAVPLHDPGATALPYVLPGMTDAAFFSRLGTQCYGFSPLVLDKQDAAEIATRMHGNDERVSKQAFCKGYGMLEETVFSYLGIS